MKPLNKQTYDRLKFITQIVLPAVGTLYFALAGIWGLPAAEAIVGTIMAVDSFLGVVLQLSTSAYQNSDERFDGVVNVLGGDGKNRDFSIGLPADAEYIESRDELVLKVEKTPGE